MADPDTGTEKPIQHAPLGWRLPHYNGHDFGSEDERKNIARYIARDLALCRSDAYRPTTRAPKANLIYTKFTGTIPVGFIPGEPDSMVFGGSAEVRLAISETENSPLFTIDNPSPLYEVTVLLSSPRPRLPQDLPVYHRIPFTVRRNTLPALMRSALCG